MVSPTTAATFYFYKSFWSVLRSQALETPQLGSHELNGRKSCWTWPGSAPKPPGTSLPDLLRNFLRNLLWRLWNLLRNPVEPDLALHQGFLEPSPEPSPEPFVTWPRPSPEPFLEPQQRWPGSVPKPPRPSPEPSEPSPEPRWTWPGACTSAHRGLFWAEDPISLHCWGKKLWKLCWPRINLGFHWFKKKRWAPRHWKFGMPHLWRKTSDLRPKLKWPLRWRFFSNNNGDIIEIYRDIVGIYS